MNFGKRRIETSNVPKLDSFSLGKVESALSLSFDKLQTAVSNELLLHAHFKQHEVQGKRTKHSVHLKLVFPGKTVVASESGWQPVKVLQKALNVLEREAIESVKRR
jgi:ribosome-associated translation inhibitor RaiA